MTVKNAEDLEIWSRAQRGAIAGLVALKPSWSDSDEVSEDAGNVADAVLAEYSSLPQEQRDVWSRSIEGVVNSLIGARGARLNPVDIASRASAIALSCVNSFGVRTNTIEKSPASMVVRHVAPTGGSDTNDGLTEGSSWATLQNALNQAPEGFDGEYLIQLGAGTFQAGVLNNLPLSTSRIMVVGYRGNAPIIDLTGASFTTADNARFSANVGAYGATITNTSHWAEPAVFPPPFVFGALLYTGTQPIASTTPNLNVAMIQDTALVALREYDTVISGDNEYRVGSIDSDFEVEFIGIHFDDTEFNALSCRFNSCKKTATEGVNQYLKNCGGFIVFSKENGRYAVFLSSDTRNTRLWNFICETSIYVVETINNSSASAGWFIITNTHADDVFGIYNASKFSIYSCEIETGAGLLIKESSTVEITDLCNFTGASIAKVETGSTLVCKGVGSDANVSGDGFVLKSGATIEGIEAAFPTATIAGTEVTLGTATSTIAALPASGSVGSNTGAT